LSISTNPACHAEARTRSRERRRAESSCGRSVSDRAAFRACGRRLRAGPRIELLENLSDDTADRLADRFDRVRRPGDVGLISIHWGSNWGYDVPEAHLRFAHRLIDGGVDLVHGHSSHHPRPLEVYRDKLVLYGCGDFLQDYEGISGHEEYRGDLVLMYFPALESTTGRRLTLSMVPMRVRKMRLNRASAREAKWLHGKMNQAQASARFTGRAELVADGILALRW
jgi:poly-gamma-glutamate capsule biosynthesis protein CapA/YwtB (metallophosphatase superfamily)